MQFHGGGGLLLGACQLRLLLLEGRGDGLQLAGKVANLLGMPRSHRLQRSRVLRFHAVDARRDFREPGLQLRRPRFVALQCLRGLGLLLFDDAVFDRQLPVEPSNLLAAVATHPLAQRTHVSHVGAIAPAALGRPTVLFTGACEFHRGICCGGVGASICLHSIHVRHLLQAIRKLGVVA